MAPAFVKRYGIALNKYKWIAAAIIAVTPMVALVIGLNQKPVDKQYRMKGILVSNEPLGVFSETGAQIQQAGKALSREILLADNVVEATSEQIGLSPNTLIKGLKVDVQQPTAEKSLQVTVVHQSRNRELSTQIIDVLLEAMIQQSRLVNTARLRSRIEAIQARLPQVIADLRAAEQRLEEYNRREEADILAARGGGLVGSIAGSQQQQRQIRLTLEGIAAQIQSLEQRLGLSVDEAYLSSALSADPLIANLRAQIHGIETQLAIQSQDLRPEHPTMVELQNQKASLEKVLQSRAAEVIGGGDVAAPLLSDVDSLEVRQDSNLDPTRQQLANTLVTLKTQQETLEQQLLAAIRAEQELRQEYATIPNKQLEQARLAQEMALKKALHDRIQAALVDAQAAEAETVTSLQVAQVASLDRILIEAPVSRWLIVGAGGGAGILTAGVLVFILSFLEGRFYTKEELQGTLRQQEAPVLGTIPLLPTALGDEDLEDVPLVFPLITAWNSPYLQDYEQVRSNLNRIGDRGARVVLVSSSSKGEGKTLTTYNLAITAARVGKRTVIIEADLRHGSQADMFGLAQDTQSRVEPLRYYGNPSECIRPVPRVENLYIVPNITPQLQPISILESCEFQRLLKDCRGRFDFVIIDAPALTLHNDALLIEPLVDGVMLVVRPGHTRNRALRDTLNQIETGEIPFLGAVINGADMPAPSAVDKMQLDEEILLLPQPILNGSSRSKVYERSLVN